jgi:hypothetical protein
MSERFYGILIKCTIAGMFIGIFGMIQPWSLALFKPGFLVLLYSTLAYTVLSHVTLRDRKPPSASADMPNG